MIDLLTDTIARPGDDPGFWRVRLADEMAQAHRAVANLMATGQATYPIVITIEDQGVEDQGEKGRHHFGRIEIRGHRPAAGGAG